RQDDRPIELLDDEWRELTITLDQPVVPALTSSFTLYALPRRAFLPKPLVGYGEVLEHLDRIPLR
ncbi:MAG: hypothetical protein KC468_26040, partial [Myxococcales bacterium]|nr:hypothetical protein [Myxococcales bacterium]